MAESSGRFTVATEECVRAALSRCQQCRDSVYTAAYGVTGGIVVSASVAGSKAVGSGETCVQGLWTAGDSMPDSAKNTSR